MGLKAAIARKALLRYQEERANSDFALLMREATPDEHLRLLDRLFEIEQEKFDHQDFNCAAASAADSEVCGEPV